MLTRLYVKNYALIRELELSFDSGLTIITGETGAGKSIILGALGLILGKRADMSTLIDRSGKCVVEGCFSGNNEELNSLLQENDIDIEEETLIRREITPAGRSRAFINDTPVNLDLLKEAGERLIDIHSQHQTLMLGNNNFQLAIIDSFSSHNGLLDNYRHIYSEYCRVKKEYDSLRSNEEQDKADFDYYNHQLTQLDEARLADGEMAELEAERDLLLHAGEVHDALSAASSTINLDENSIVPRLGEVKRFIDRINDFLPDSIKYSERIESVLIELNDLSNEIERKLGSVESDPGRLGKLEERLDTLYALLQKHRVESIGELISVRENIRKKVNDISTGDERLDELRKLLNKLNENLLSMASEISARRNDVIPEVETRMTDLLSALGMPNGNFKIDMHRTDRFTATGLDFADFLFSANRQVAPEDLGRVASGGELSRVMLSLKSMLTDNSKLPTIFFDEIDSGVSGEVADKVGQILSDMGKRMQVINITHLPQVAVHGTMHYYVYKEEEGNSTITRIKLLDKDERINEIARLLSGDKITPASLENAKELISRT